MSSQIRLKASRGVDSLHFSLVPSNGAPFPASASHKPSILVAMRVDEVAGAIVRVSWHAVDFCSEESLWTQLDISWSLHRQKY